MRISDWSSDVCSSDLDASVLLEHLQPDFSGGFPQFLDVVPGRQIGRDIELPRPPQFAGDRQCFFSTLSYRRQTLLDVGAAPGLGPGPGHTQYRHEATRPLLSFRPLTVPIPTRQT